MTSVRATITRELACVAALALTECDHREVPAMHADAADPPALTASSPVDAPSAPQARLPPHGLLYHAVFPGSAANPGSEDAITSSDLDAYEGAVGHRVAWVYFSHEWAHGEAFPVATATWIRARGALPFIRMMTRTVAETGRTTRETTYALSTIVAGAHDAALSAWGDAARAFGTPIIVEWGTEMNGKWFPWNASHNGEARGAILFKNAYQHIVSVLKSRGANNLIFVFHVNGDDQPPAPWNRLEAYYPGDEWVDWLGLSAYGTQSPEGPCADFVQYVDDAVARLSAMAPSKPIFVLELGTAAASRHCRPTPEGWTRAALDALLSGRWPAVRGFSWWNERWENEGSSEATDMRVQDAPGIASVFRQELARDLTLDRPF